MENAYTNTVINDTDSIYFCSLTDNGSDIDDKGLVFGIMSIGYSVLGLIPDSGGFGFALGGNSILFTLYTIVEGKIFRSDPTERILAPARSITRESSGLGIKNSLALTRMRVDPQDTQRIVVEIGKKEGISTDGVILLSQVDGITWNTVLELSSDRGQRIEPRSLVTVPYFYADSKSSSFSIHKNMISYDANDWFRYKTKNSEGSAEHYKLQDWKNEINLKYDKDYNSSFIDIPNPEAVKTRPPDAPDKGDYSETAVLEYTNKGGGRGLILRLKGFKIVTSSDGRTQSLGSAGGQQDVLGRIADNPGYPAYFWQGSGSSVDGYINYTTMNIDPVTPAARENSYVYIPVSNERPYLRLTST